jgi:hypothetical protein
MYQPSSNPLSNGRQGMNPLPAAMVARMLANRQRINTAANNAETAVLGYCSNPASYGVSPNIASEIVKAPSSASIVQAAAASSTDPLSAFTSTPAASSILSSGGAPSAAAVANAGGAGAPGAAPVFRCWSDRPVTNVPFGSGLTVPPVIPSQAIAPVPQAALPVPAYTAPSVAPAAPVTSPVTAWPTYTPPSLVGSFTPFSSIGQTNSPLTYNTVNRGPQANLANGPILLGPQQVRYGNNSGFGNLPPWGNQFVDQAGQAASQLALPASWFASNPGIVAAAVLIVSALLLGKN